MTGPAGVAVQAPTARLALGTVQFGLNYGVASETGQVSLEDVGAIVRAAREMGLDTLDTASAYGESEARLGSTGVADWHVVTKLRAAPVGCGDVDEWVRESVRGSLHRLRVPQLDGLLVHDADQLRAGRGPALFDALRALKDDGLVRKIGVSIYDADELDALSPRYRFDLVQAPFNVFDRRLAESGWLARLTDDGTEVHVRSVFLQGLLVTPADRHPAYFQRWAALWAAWRTWLREHEITPVAGALGVALAEPGISRVVVGVDTLSHLREIAASAAGPLQSPPRSLATDDVFLINPSLWREQ